MMPAEVDRELRQQEADARADILPIPDWPGYLASSAGRIFSQWTRVVVPFAGSRSVIDPNVVRELKTFDRNAYLNGRERESRLLGRTLRCGYRSVTLRRDGKQRVEYVHALVLLTFVGPRPTPNHEGLHENDIRDDNRLSNLRWGTPRDNADDRLAHGTVLRGESHPGAKTTAAIVGQVRELLARGYSDTAIGEALGIGRASVWQIRAGKQWTSVAPYAGAPS